MEVMFVHFESAAQQAAAPDGREAVDARPRVSRGRWTDG
jgi:hypothetical protein